MSERKIPFWQWLLAGILLVGTLTLAVVLNQNLGKDISLTDPGTIDIDNGDTKINWDRYPTYEVELSSTYTISESGTYHFTGEISDGMIEIKTPASAVVKLVLDNVTIKNPNGPAIACYDGEDLVIETLGNNYLEDGTKYAASFDEDVNGAIYSKADLTFEGDGTLTVIANYQDGIVSKDDLKINGGTYNITANDDGIRGKDSVYIVDGAISVSTRGDGIKSTNDTDTAKGFVLIAGGKIEVAKSYEGLEARLVIIDGGSISIFANDDGINADEKITINDGEVYVNAAGDGIDSNGYLYINGGNLIVDGPTNNGNGALDAGYEIAMYGGRAIAVGASGMAESLGTNSSVYNVSIFFTTTLPKDTLVEIKNSSDQTVLAHTAVKTFSHMAAGTTDFKSGETYTIYINGKKYQEFTISSIVTTVGNGGAAGMNGAGGAAPGRAGAPR